MPDSSKVYWSPRAVFTVGLSFMVGLGAAVGMGALLLDINKKKAEARQYPMMMLKIPENELDPAVWGRDFPREYASFKMTQKSDTQTPYGGSVPYSKLERYPAMKRIWAGYAFSVEHNEERGHFYTLIDQKHTERIKVKSQPGACANCHSADAPALIKKMGWEKFNHTPYNVLKADLHHGTSCADCHDPKSMDLRITRPAFKNAMAARGIDLAKATRQEMRTYVCAQCHVEYFFKGDNKVLTFPWKKGLNIDSIDAYYDEIKFTDWTHKESNAQMIKIQHPEFEMWSSGIHARSGVACADCHMPYMRDGAVKVSDHWLRSPLTNINRACQTCHRQDEDELKARVALIQDRTAELLKKSETAIIDAIDAIAAAQKAGATDAELAEARKLHRKASMRWDFVSSENSTGFHSSQEAARVLADARDYARQAQLSAEMARMKRVQKRL